MPLPIPLPDEERNDFISRCMGDDEAKSKFPDAKQRLTYCFSAGKPKKTDDAVTTTKSYDGPSWIPDKVGAHAHGNILRDVKQTSSDGNHPHVWLVEQDMAVGENVIKAPFLLMSDYDGAHSHPIDESGLYTVDGAGAHRHAVHFPGGTVVATEEDGAHAHEVHVQDTPWDGQHVHVLKVGTLSLTSLTGPAIAALRYKAAEGETISIIRAADASYPADIQKTLLRNDRAVGKVISPRDLLLRQMLGR
jgi:hypothetical protein